MLSVIAAEPGTGKTRFALDLARRLWHGLPWPDNAANTLPPGSRTLWVPGDRNFHELLSVARAFGIPEESVTLGSAPDDPTGSLDLDDPETLSALRLRIEAAEPALLVLDTVGMVTSRNLCKPEDARAFFAPLMELAARTNVSVLGLTHLSKDKEALGRRIVEKARSLLKITRPDPDGQPNRRRLWVDKTAVVPPPPLGITMGEAGNDYDFNPPTEPEAPRTGRPPESCDKARQFILETLRARNDRKLTELCHEWEATGKNKSALYRARDVLVKAGELVCEGRPLVLHLNGERDDEPD